MFAFKDENRDKNITKAKEMLEALMGQVPSLLSMEVGINFSTEGRAMDLSIITIFENREKLDAYAVDPAHLKVVEFIKSVVSSSKVVDYEIERETV
jgi:antibiotic biosynthesis monooxygenase (ABM) superfamily enzyme